MSKSDFKPVVGIDLGTTFSKIAYIDEFKTPIVIPNQENKPITPSVINFYDQDTFVVGDEAVNQMIADQDNTVSFIKRRMGDPNFKVNIHGKDYTPQELSAFILKKLKRDAEYYFKNNGLDIEVKDAVITVPAYFGMDQKGATKEAGEIAGLNVLSIISEPTAVGLAYWFHKFEKDHCALVFDLGGTFDVTILEIKGNKIAMIAADGDCMLGGKDWDDILINYCSNKFKAKYGEDPRDDYLSYQELYERVLTAKIGLSKLPKALIIVSHNKQRENVEVTRELFEELSEDLLKACKSACERVMKGANKSWHDIDMVLLVGGATYMPMIRNLVKEMSGKEPCTEVQPDQCVVIGAAYCGWQIAHPIGCSCNACKAHFLNEKNKDTALQVVEHNENITKIEKFLKIARAYDEYSTCEDLYCFLGISNRNATKDEIKSIIGEKKKYFRLKENIAKWAMLAREFLTAQLSIEYVLLENRTEYDKYLIATKAKELRKYFSFCTKHDRELDSKEKQYLIKEGKELGLSEREILELINRWLAEDGVKEFAPASPDSSCSSRLPYNIGLLVLNSNGQEDVAILFHKDIELPAESCESVSVAYDGQSSLGLDLIEGMGDNVTDYVKIGKIIVEFKLAKKKGEPCDIFFMIPQYGVMKVKFKCENEEINQEIKLSSGREKVVFDNKKKSSTIRITEEPTCVSHDFLGKTYYEILGVPEDADYSQIKAAYEKEYEKYIWTRDKNKSNPRWDVVSEAWEALKDPVKRKKYDEQVRVIKPRQ
jgi:molecular chaperone DnaK (HSP70)